MPPCSCPRRSRWSSRPSPSERRAHAIGLWGASAAVAAGVGPPIGGALVQLGDWRWAFLVNLPFGVAALWASRSHLVESRAPGRRAVPDLVGAALLAAALALLNLGDRQERATGAGRAPRSSARWPAPPCSSAPSCSASRRHPSPLLDPALLRIPSFTVGFDRDRRRGRRVLRLPAHQHPVAAVRLGVRRPARRTRTRAGRAGGRRRRRPARSPGRAASATGRSSCPGRSSGRAPTSGTTSRSASSRRSGPSGCRDRCSAASESGRPCRCWAAQRWRPCRVGATRRRPRWSPAPGSSAACSASPSSS